MGARGAEVGAPAGPSVERDEGVHDGEERGERGETVERAFEPGRTGYREGEFQEYGGMAGG